METDFDNSGVTALESDNGGVTALESDNGGVAATDVPEPTILESINSRMPDQIYEAFACSSRLPLDGVRVSNAIVEAIRRIGGSRRVTNETTSKLLIAGILANGGFSEAEIALVGQSLRDAAQREADLREQSRRRTEMLERERREDAEAKAAQDREWQELTQCNERDNAASETARRAESERNAAGVERATSRNLATVALAAGAAEREGAFALPDSDFDEHPSPDAQDDAGGEGDAADADRDPTLVEVERIIEKARTLGQFHITGIEWGILRDAGRMDDVKNFPI